MFDILHVGFKPQHLGLPLIVRVLMITVQNQPFCDSALWHLLLHSWEKKTTTTTSAVLLPQLQNFYHAAEK